MRNRTESLSSKHLGARPKKNANTDFVNDESKTQNADMQAYFESIEARKNEKINQQREPEVEPHETEKVELDIVVDLADEYEYDDYELLTPILLPISPDENKNNIIWHSLVELIQDKDYWQIQGSPKILVNMRKILDNHESNEIQFKELQNLVRKKTNNKPGFFDRSNIMKQCLYKIFEAKSILDLETNDYYLKLQDGRRAYQQAEIKTLLSNPSKANAKLEEPIDLGMEIQVLKSKPIKLLPLSREYGPIKSEVKPIIESIESPPKNYRRR